MKTKDRGLAQTLLWNVCDAPKAQFGQFMTIALTCLFGTSQTPQIGGLRQPGLPKLAEQSENVYENKGSWVRADIALECLRCAGGTVRTKCPLILTCPFGTSRTAQIGVCANRLPSS